MMTEPLNRSGQPRRNPERILYVYSGKALPQNSGLDLVVRQQLKALTTAGYQVTFVSRGKYDHPSVLNFSLPLTPANLGSMLGAKYYYNLQHRFFSFLGASVLRQSRHDALICWQGASRSLLKTAAALRVPSLLNIPAMFPQDGSGLSKARFKLLSWLVPDISYRIEEYNLTSALLTASEQSRQSFVQAGYSESKVINIQRGADLTRFKSQPRPDRPFRVAFFGRVCDRKGIFQTLDAWEKAALPNSELWIIGAVDGAVKDELLLKMPANARLFGHRNDAELLLPQCDVQILPTAFEGMAKTLVEGAACGCVSLVTRESGFPVVEGKTGFFIERSDTDTIARRLKDLEGDRDLLKAMHQQSSDFVKQNLSWERFSERFLEAVGAVIQSGAGAAFQAGGRRL